MSRRLVALGAALALVLGSSCRDAGPVAGTLKVKVTLPQTAGTNDAAILFTLTGPVAPAGVTAGAGFQVYHQPLATSTKIAVMGPLTNGATLVTLNVDDVRRSYTGTVEQVAVINYQLRGSLTGYAISITR